MERPDHSSTSTLESNAQRAVILLHFIKLQFYPNEIHLKILGIQLRYDQRPLCAHFNAQSNCIS